MVIKWKSLFAGPVLYSNFNKIVVRHGRSSQNVPTLHPVITVISVKTASWQEFLLQPNSQWIQLHPGGEPISCTAVPIATA